MNTSDPDFDDLDARLRALFADSRLDVTLDEPAGERIVAGARRLRRRRAVLTSGSTTLGIVAVAAAVVVLGARTAGQDGETPVAASPAGPPPASASVLSTSESPEPPELPSPDGSREPEAAPSPPDLPSSSYPGAMTAMSPPVQTGSVLAADAVLAPDGYRALKLGMPYHEAVATNMLMTSDETSPPSPCADYELAEGDELVRTVTISRQYGVVGFAANSAVTPEGAGVGTPFDQLRSLYPNGSLTEAAYTVATGAGFYEFRVPDGVVVEVALKARASDC